MLRVCIARAVIRGKRFLFAMIQKIDVPVSVTLNFDSQTREVFPRRIIWNRRLYPIIKLGFHHTFRRGRTLYHVFSVAGKTLFFRLVLNTETLHWRLEEITDNEGN